MIYGIGTDLIKISRIKTAVDNLGPKFLDKIFTPLEQNYCLKYKEPYAKLANRFAVKEAVSKAFGRGILELGFRNIEVANDNSGKPEIVLYNNALNYFNSIKGKKMHVSVTDTEEYSLVFCMLEI